MYRWAPEFLSHFLDNTNAVYEQTSTPITIISNEPSLSHNVGVIFGTSPNAEKLTFPASSDLTQDILASKEFVATIKSQLGDRATEVHDFFVNPNHANCTEYSLEITYLDNIGFNPDDWWWTDPLGHDISTDLYYTFATATLNITISAMVRRSDGAVTGLSVAGTMTDLYDFKWTPGDGTTLASNAARVQAAFNGGSIGQIFKIEVTVTNGLPDIQYTYPRTW